MGGLYFFVNSFLSQVLLWLAVRLYLTNESMEADESIEVDEELLWRIGIITSSVWIVSFITIFIKCKSGYRKTFISVATGKQFSKATWYFMMETEKSDEIIVNSIFKKHHDMYKHFDDEVKQWIESNWEKWQREQPKWFTKELIKHLEREFVS